jgi:hypothetical protein
MQLLSAMLDAHLERHVPSDDDATEWDVWMHSVGGHGVRSVRGDIQGPAATVTTRSMRVRVRDGISQAATGLFPLSIPCAAAASSSTGRNFQKIFFMVTLSCKRFWVLTLENLWRGLLCSDCRTC